VLEEAIVSRTYNDRKQLLTTILAAFAALGLVFYGVAYWEWRAHRINSPDDIVEGLGMPLVGTLPYLRTLAHPRPTDVKPGVGSTVGSLAELTEAADGMRAVVLHSRHDRSPRVIMVTSALGSEGKTSLASNLAASLARGGYRTLLLDTDLRRPALHRVFDLPLAPGFQEALRSERSVDDVIQASSLPGLSILTAGHLATHPAKVLVREKLQGIIGHLRHKFDCIVIDSCPVLPVADTLIVGQLADVVVLSMMRGRSCVPQVQAACQKLGRVGIEIIGAILSGTVPESHQYGYECELKTPGIPVKTLVNA
jgi:capsular exopolysaccharide synthesis family protein